MQGFILLLLLTLSVSSAFAMTSPTFPGCANPQGLLKTVFSEGTHGIIGETNTYTGSDAVYSLTEDTLVQCFCSINGNGIQTNWWKASSLTPEEIDTLKNQDWQLVPNGALWGLEETAYLALNSDYGCLPDSEANNAIVTSSGDDGNSTNTTHGPTGEVLAAATTAVGEILGLADTGNQWKMYLLLVMGVTFVGLGFHCLRKSSG